MKKVLIVTGTRAEYGLLKPLIKKLIKLKKSDIGLLVTGTHLEKKFGFSISEIEKDKLPIWGRIKINAKGYGPDSICNSLSIAIKKFSSFLKNVLPDMVVLLGDRYEILAMANVATIYKIPIAHIHGGEATEGLIDEAIRHSITKMSHLHFTSTNIYKKRVIQMGEKPNLVFNVGALGVENLKEIKKYSKIELENIYKIKFKKSIFLITYHPVTLSNKSPEIDINEILSSLNQFNETTFFFSYPNADTHSNKILKPIEKFIKKNKKNAIMVKNLGFEKYISLMSISSVIVGNSSSGIIEAPSVNVPTVNIGIRQNGRIKAKSVLSCKNDEASITKTIKKALSKKFKNQIKKYNNPYSKDNTSFLIADIINKIDEKKLLLKTFYNIK